MGIPVEVYRDEAEVRDIWDCASLVFKRIWRDREVRVRLMAKRASQHRVYAAWYKGGETEESESGRVGRDGIPPSMKDPYSQEEIKAAEQQVGDEEAFQCFLRFMKAASRDHSPGFGSFGSPVVPPVPPVPRWR